MTKKLLNIVVCVAAASLLLAAFSACPTEAEGVSTYKPPVISDYNDVPVTNSTIVGTRWSDGQNPEDTITFTSATSLELEGRYFQKKMQVNGNTTATQKLIDLSGTHLYEVKNANEVESPYSDSNADGVVNILINADKRTGIQAYLYAADTTTGKHQRLIVYSIGILQAREFYLPK